MGDGRTWLRSRLLLVAATVFATLSVVLTGVAIWLYPHFFAPNVDVDPGVGLATIGLALFTGLLFLAAAVTAFFAYEEISRSTAAHSANLALQMDNRFHSDRALRIRHGAVTFLANHQRDSNGELKRELDLACYHNISPYDTKQALWHGLTSDLIDLFNYFDWMGYLADEKTKAVKEEVIAQKFGPWIINYYQTCKDELAVVQDIYPTRWRHLPRLYKRLIQREIDQYERIGEPYPGERKPEQINAFLQREHIRSHRGFFGSDSNGPESNVHLPSRAKKPKLYNTAARTLREITGRASLA